MLVRYDQASFIDAKAGATANFAPDRDYSILIFLK